MARGGGGCGGGGSGGAYIKGRGGAAWRRGQGEGGGVRLGLLVRVGVGGTRAGKAAAAAWLGWALGPVGRGNFFFFK